MDFEVVQIGDNSVLVVAFDGLDYDLLQRFNCTAFTEMVEFGQIDNHTGISEIKTSELFASFITGETHNEHGITGLTKWTDEAAGSFIDTIAPFSKLDTVPGLHTLRNVLKAVANVKQVKYTAENLESLSLFDHIEDSVPLFVPSYNPSWFWRIGGGIQSLEYGGGPEQVEELYEREHPYRRQKLWEVLDEETHDLVMCHFHKPDALQHSYGDRDALYDEQRLEQLYEEMDALAAKIKEQAEDYDIILFMSDHGLPQPGLWEHNRNAFYATNTNTGLEAPHITEFYQIVQDLIKKSRTDQYLVEQVDT